MISKKIGISAIFAFILSLSGPAQAQDIHPYAGAGLGVVMFDLGPGIGTKNAFGGFGQFGIDYGDFIGAELRVGSTSNVSFTYLGLNGRAGIDYFFSYLAKLQLPVSEQLRIYGLAGGTTAKASVTISIPGSIFSASASSTSSELSFGGGMDVKIQDQWHAGVEYMRYANDTRGISANLKYLF